MPNIGIASEVISFPLEFKYYTFNIKPAADFLSCDVDGFFDCALYRFAQSVNARRQRLWLYYKHPGGLLENTGLTAGLMRAAQGFGQINLPATEAGIKLVSDRISEGPPRRYVIDLTFSPAHLEMLSHIKEKCLFNRRDEPWLWGEIIDWKLREIQAAKKGCQLVAADREVIDHVFSNLREPFDPI